MIIPKHYEDLSVLHEGTMPDRAYYVPAGRRMKCLVENREASDRIHMLNGSWKFRFFDSIYDLKEEFYRTDFDVSGFEEIPVPGVWQNYGYGRHQYTNIRYPFPADPPYVPQENPCGAYVHRFLFEKKEDLPRTFLEFEGVDSCFYVWLNGQYIGYSQVSHALSEFEITDQLVEGENVLAVLVLKWCDGSYLEDQDKFRVSGIFRDVYLLRRPDQYIFDYTIRSQIVWEEGKKEVPRAESAMLSVKVEYLEKAAPVTASLLDAEENEICRFQFEGETEFTIEDPHLWNSEDPYLYTLFMETRGEVIAEQIGIREITVEGNVVLINRRPVRFRGVNRHDWDPVSGPVVRVDHIRRDLEMMKRYNFNAIRTSHYPNAPMFYQMCDRYGFFVIDEADNESHGLWMLCYREDTDEERAARWNEMVSDNPAFITATLDRTKKLVYRDKNRPCVVIWSMGNESSYGCTFEEALRWTKAYDPTRLTHYEGAWNPGSARTFDHSNIDLYSRMYPAFEDVISYAESDPEKPFIMCEYCHSMGNGAGDYEDYFGLMENYDCICGGFVWEWSDHAVYKGTAADGRSIYYYGGDHGEYPHDGNFCVDGLVYPDRTPHTGLLEYKNVHRPARVVSWACGSSVQEILKGETDPARARALKTDHADSVRPGAVHMHDHSGNAQTTCILNIKNEMNFVDLQEYITLEYEVTCDDVRIAGDVVSAPQIPSVLPGKTGRIFLSLPSLPEEGKIYMKVFYLLRKADEFREEGMLLGFDEIPLQTDRGNRMVITMEKDSNVCANKMKKIRVKEDERRLILKGESFNYVYSRLYGIFEKMSFEDKEILDKPMELNIWRAPTDNDRYIRMEWERAMYDRTRSRAYTTEWTMLENAVQIHSKIGILAPTVQRIMDIDAVWTVTFSGRISVHMDVKRNTDFPELPRFGLRLFLPETMQNAVYYGLGPLESYIDKHRASWHGLFAATVRDLHEDYLRPQENGSRCGCDFMTLRDNSFSLTAFSRIPFSFNVSAYTQEELTRKAHNYELSPCGSTVLCLDARQNGIGSNSCGPRLLPEYRFDDEAFTYDMTLLPCMGSTEACTCED